jgi:mono/diheme cytochrome c family protein
MKTKFAFLILFGLVFGYGSFWLFALPDLAERAWPQSAAALERGAYLLTAGGCISCHRGEGEDNEATLGGGLAIDTDFGIFYAPNITPDVATGIGGWSARDFLLALKHGRNPAGSFYYPAFPYRAYAGLTDRDALAIGAYLMSLDPVSNQVPQPQVPVWLSRWAVAGWNRLADLAQPVEEEFDEELVARGAYLARHLGHCSECHTPRNGLGIPDHSREYAGATLGDDVIEPIDAEALVDWTFNNFDLFLLLGMKPDTEFVGGDMNEVIEYNTSKLTDEDRDALAAFFTRHNAPD